MNSIKNRYELLFFIAATNANPNGDPDMDNRPRTDAETGKGLMTGTSLKYRIRKDITARHGHEPGMNMLIQDSINVNRKIAEAKTLAGVKLSDKSKPAVDASRLKACETYFDVRAFGGVLAVGPNAGQIQGPVQIPISTSVDVVEPVDMGITRCCKTVDVKDAKTLQDYIDHENAADPDGLRTMGRMQYIPFGLYPVHVYVSANEAERTGFDETDFKYLLEAISKMYDINRSVSKGEMAVVSPIIIFQHNGEPNVPEDERIRSARLGRAPAHKLFELVTCERKPDVDVARSYKDYLCQVNVSDLPHGVRIGFKPTYEDDICWDHLPTGEKWMTEI